MKSAHHTLCEIIEDYYKAYHLFDDDIQFTKDVGQYIAVSETNKLLRAGGGYDPLYTVDHYVLIELLLEPSIQRIRREVEKVRQLDALDEPGEPIKRHYTTFEIRDMFKVLVSETWGENIMCVEFCWRDDSRVEVIIDQDSLSMLKSEFWKDLEMWHDFDKEFLFRVLQKNNYTEI